MGTLYDLLSGAPYALDTPGALLRGALAGKPGTRLDGRELLENWGVLDQNKEGLDSGDVLGFGADLLIDPVNLLGGAGLAKLTKTLVKGRKASRAYQGLAGAAARQGAEAVAKEPLSPLAGRLGASEAIRGQEALAPQVARMADEAVHPAVIRQSPPQVRPPQPSPGNLETGQLARQIKSEAIGPLPNKNKANMHAKLNPGSMVEKRPDGWYVVAKGAGEGEAWKGAVIASLQGKTKVDDLVELPQLWKQVQSQHPNLSLEDFQQGLLEMHDTGKIKLEDYTRAWADVIDNPLAIKHPREFNEQGGYGLKWYARGR